MGKTKYSLFVVFILLMNLNTIFAQQNTTQSDNSNQLELINTENQNNIVQDDYFSAMNNQTEDATLSSKSSTWVYVKMILFLILVVVAIYSVMYFFKKKTNPKNDDDSFLRRVNTLPLGPGKSVEVVSLIDQAYILGVTDNNINLIDKIEDKELIEALNLNYDKNKNVKKPMNFADILDIFMPNGPRNKNVFSDQEKKIKNLSKKKE